MSRSLFLKKMEGNKFRIEREGGETKKQKHQVLPGSG